MSSSVATSVAQFAVVVATNLSRPHRAPLLRARNVALTTLLAVGLIQTAGRNARACPLAHVE